MNSLAAEMNKHSGWIREHLAEFGARKERLNVAVAEVRHAIVELQGDAGQTKLAGMAGEVIK